MDRRSFLKGAAALFAAPAIVKAEILMPVKQPIWQPRPYEVVIDANGHTASEVYDAMKWVVRCNWEQRSIEINPEVSQLSITDFYREVKKEMMRDPEALLYPQPLEGLHAPMPGAPAHIRTRDGYRVEQGSIMRLTDGSLIQGDEYYSNFRSVGGE